MPLRIQLDGDKAKACSFLGWAKSKLFMLKANMKLLDIKQDRRVYALDGIKVWISSIFGDDLIRIEAESAFSIVVADTGNNRIQIFDANYNLTGKFGSYGTVHEPQKFWLPNEVSMSGDEIFIANKNQGWLDVYDLNGSYLRGRFENKYVQDVATGDGKIAVSEAEIGFPIFVYVYDNNLNQIALITKEPDTDEGLGGLAIGGGYLFVAVNQNSGANAKCLRIYSLDNFSLVKTINTGGGPHIHYDGGAFYDGKYYGVQIGMSGGLKIDVFENLAYKETFTDTANFQVSPSQLSARGIAVTKDGIFVTVLGQGDHAVFPNPSRDKVYRYDLAGNFVSSFGGSGSGDKQFVNPWGITVRA